jgi:hypothetical protein
VDGMGKPFDKDLADMATQKAAELVSLLNKHLKKFHAKLGPGKDSDIIITYLPEPSVNIFVEVEVVRADRWERIKKGKYPTVRWPLAKKHKCENYSKVGKLLILLSVNESNLNEMFYIDCESWVKQGHEEKAPFVKAGGKGYRYRKGQEEPFWAIEKERVMWGIEKFEDFLLTLLKGKNAEMMG